MLRLTFLRPDDPPAGFPDPRTALREPDGLLAAGGDLSPARLLAAYRRGIFPWYQAGQPILWWSPDPRCVLLPGALHLSRSLRKTLRRETFSISVDADFAGVITQCATAGKRGRGQTWITPEMHAAYLALHASGHAHAVECWQEGQLVGGLYGVVLGHVFFGESMFSRSRDASKAALAALVRLCPRHDIRLIDCQVANDHLASLGSELMPRDAFLARLDELAGDGGPSPGWALPRTPFSTLDPAG